MERLLKLRNLLFKYILLYFSSLVPKERNRLVFGAWLGEKYSDNSRYLYEFVLENRPDLNPIWITANQSIIENLTFEGKPVVKSDTTEAFKILLTAKYIFTVTGRMDIGKWGSNIIGGANYINLWHGIPLKKIMYDNDYILSNNIRDRITQCLEWLPLRKYYVVSTSEKISKIYESAFRVGKKQILELGQPRNDYFFYEHDSISLRNKFPNKKIISYMPTHRNEGKKAIDLNELFDLKVLNEWCEENDVIFIIKKHFYHQDDPLLCGNYSSIIDYTLADVDSQTLLKFSDILITDYSSCYIDYLLLNRPIVFFNYDYQEYLSEDRQLYFDYQEVTPGAKCQNFGELFKNLDDIIAGKDDFYKERQRVIEIFYSEKNRFQVSERLIKEVLGD